MIVVLNEYTNEPTMWYYNENNELIIWQGQVDKEFKSNWRDMGLVRLFETNSLNLIYDDGEE